MNQIREIVEAISALAKRVRLLESRPYIQTPDMATIQWGSYGGALKGVSTNGINPWTTTVAYNATIRYAKMAVYVDTPNNIANYWTISIHNKAGYTIAHFTTASIEQEKWVVMDFTIDIASIATDDIYLSVVATKNGHPGALSGMCPLVYIG